ncbi:hypothetical protein GTA08_BOTSDO07875 [Botryosphaeria dothidea]|uniref:Uncharacterized protein n=1 Tax=Botryosphaeria dothidea TaxID=55169 RepID=A0A8H4N017_9PEZI|nr:hypothetical protein GTA08_BOTSDO07875 [Botryosphaeria dothidea]
MYTARALAEVASFRAINYADDPAVVTVSTGLRQAWITLPSLIPAATDNPTSRDGSAGRRPQLGAIIRAAQSASSTPSRHPEKEDVHTRLRAAVHYYWNHVFWDVAQFLEGETGGSTGHLHPPAEDVFAVRYPVGGQGDGGMVVVEEKVFETNVLVVPTFVEEGTRVRIDVGKGKGDGCELDATEVDGMYNEAEVYWIRKGERVRISLGGAVGEDRSGVAAVFVYGQLCDCRQEKNGVLHEDDPKLDDGESKSGNDIDDTEPGVMRADGKSENHTERHDPLENNRSGSSGQGS